MSLKTYAIAAILLFVSLPAYTKEVSYPCGQSYVPCKPLPKVLKSSTEVISLTYERTIDGDTFVAGGQKIRVWGINAPERGDAAYMASTWLMDSLIKDKALECRFLYLDRYKRSVMQCDADGADIAATMVKFGMAIDYKKYSSGYYAPEENEAKAAKRGIWSDEYRKIPKSHR